jgi:hypothetical protein
MSRKVPNYEPFQSPSDNAERIVKIYEKREKIETGDTHAIFYIASKFLTVRTDSDVYRKLLKTMMPSMTGDKGECAFVLEGLPQHKLKDFVIL